MRSIWSGSVGIGLLNLPIKIGSAVQDNDIKLAQHAPDGSKIKYKRVSEATGEEVPYSEIRMGYDAPDGSVVFLDSDDFEKAYGRVSREAEILMFADAGDVPDIAKAKPYYIQPAKGAEKTYSLIAAALNKTGKVAIVKVGMRQRKRLAVLSATEDGYLVLEQLEWAQDIRKPDFEAPDGANDAEVDMACKLIDTMTKTFRHEEWEDDSQAALNELISKKIETGQVTGGFVAETGPKSGAMDLMATLTASIEANKKTPAKKTATRGARKSA